MNGKPHALASTRFSVNEVVTGVNANCRTRKDFRQHASRRRIRKAPFVMSGAEVAWALVVEHQWVYTAIRNGLLPADKEFFPNGSYRWRCRRGDVERLARELYP